jgi:hypothetical protein
VYIVLKCFVFFYYSYKTLEVNTPEERRLETRRQVKAYARMKWLFTNWDVKMALRDYCETYDPEYRDHIGADSRHPTAGLFQYVFRFRPKLKRQVLMI